MKSAIVLVAFLALLFVSGCGSGSQSTSPTLNVSGQWQITTSTGGAGALTLNQQGTQVTGSGSETDFVNAQISGTVTGNSLTATMTATYDGPDQCIGLSNPVTINLTGTVAADGNSISGQFATQQSCLNFSGTWTATKM